MLHKVNKSASYIYRISNRTSVVTQQEGLEIKLWFATSAKENIVAKNRAWVFTIKNCNGKEWETETLTSSNPAPNLRKSVRIAPASHNLLQGQDRYMYSHTTSFLLSQHRKAGRWWISHRCLSHTSRSLWQQRTSFSAATMSQILNQIS